ncbi:unnamed protein product, partial [Anisakis simplex]|uniref:Neur_chan_LBD domain-containing protein n=1 Tax=Anisakis simplex TaxID=6269 RepID=A0A0M3J3F7_ANISI
MESTSPPLALADYLSAVLLNVLVNGQSQKILRSQRIGVEGQILAKLFSDYDQFTRPPVRGYGAQHSSILVITSLFIDHIKWHHDQALMQSEQRTLLKEVNMYLRQQWQDTRLAYEVDQREGVEEVVLPSNRQIWEPDTYFSNAEDIRHEHRRHTVIEPSGHVRCSEMFV